MARQTDQNMDHRTSQFASTVIDHQNFRGRRTMTKDEAEEIVRRLRSLDDGVSRPVSIMEREVCGLAANAIEAFTSVLAGSQTKCGCLACDVDGPHASSCAVHNGTAMAIGPCDCGAAALSARK